MNISLTPALERLVEAKVRAGYYRSASELFREALRHRFPADLPSDTSLETSEKEKAHEDTTIYDD